MEINPDSPARVISGKTPGTDGVNTAGIVIGAVAVAVSVLVLMVAILITRKRVVGKPAFDELQPVSTIPSGKEIESDSAATEELDSAEEQRTDEEVGTVQSGKAILGATKAYYGQSSSDAYIGGRSRASSTASAGKSDWPSICMSSLNSGSAGGESADELDPLTFGTIMFDADTGCTELDNAIVTGDRAAVGATAALLAANASGRCDYESSFSSHQGSIETGDSSLRVRVDEQKAAELHRLIEGGDWEGIIRAAQTFSSDGNSSDGSSSLEKLLDPTNCGTIMVDMGTGSTEFDNAIVAGDRAGDQATVGAATVLLATNASGQWDCESSVSSRQSSVSSVVLVDEPKAAELRRLLQVRDWEGVRRAASSFSSDEHKSFDGSILSYQDSKGSMHSNFIERSNLDPVEMRRQVEELLQQVAPEDMDHMDETLLQFKGREDELLMTLQTMQERQLSTRLELQPKSELPE
jgi:hypothetical protein